MSTQWLPLMCTLSRNSLEHVSKYHAFQPRRALGLVRCGLQPEWYGHWVTAIYFHFTGVLSLMNLGCLG